MKEWAKKNILQLIIILGFVIFGLITCNKGSWPFGTHTPKNDTVFSTKTEYVQQPAQVIPQYIPIQTGSTAPIILPPQYTQLPTDTAALGKMLKDLAEKYFTQNIYKDSIILKDTSGRNVGLVKLEDMVSENQIKWRKPSYQLSFPVTTNTITITKYPPQKAKFYIGAGIAGGKENILNQASLGLIYDSKKDALWQIKANYNFQGSLSYELGRYWKISLRK